MKLTSCIAAAILAFCAAAAPVNITNVETSVALPSEPILIFTSPTGLIKPASPRKPNIMSIESGKLEDFPRVVENQHGNNTANPNRPMFRPNGHGGHGPVVHPRPEINHDATLQWQETVSATDGPLHSNITLINSIKNTLGLNIRHLASLEKTDNKLPASKGDEVSVSFHSTGDETQGKCVAKAHGTRSIDHEHDIEHIVIDECDANTREDNSKQGDTITSKSRTSISSVHSDHSGESHKDFEDGAGSPSGLDGLNDLPPQLREHYLDELAKLNSNNMNRKIDQTHSNSTLTTDSTINAKEGSSSTETRLHTINMTVHKDHDEVKIDIKRPVPLDHSMVKSEIHTSSLSPLKPSSISSVHTAAPIESTSSSQSTTAKETSTTSTTALVLSPWTRGIFKHTITPITSSSVPQPTSSTTIIANDDDTPLLKFEFVVSNNQELEPSQPERRGDQKAYIAAVQSLNAKHMDQVQECEKNITCIAASNREFSSALAELDYFS